MKLRERYKLNKSSKVGDTCICPSCDTTFIKTNYQQVFCRSRVSTKCKDKYWNTITPTKRCNNTRISPASARWMSKQKENARYDSDNNEHPFSSEALGQW